MLICIGDGIRDSLINCHGCPRCRDLSRTAVSQQKGCRCCLCCREYSIALTFGIPAFNVYLWFIALRLMQKPDRVMM